MLKRLVLLVMVAPTVGACSLGQSSHGSVVRAGAVAPATTVAPAPVSPVGVPAGVPPGPVPAAPGPTAVPAPAVAAPPHFDTPVAAMEYLTSAYNRRDMTDIRHVTTPAARADLVGMYSEAVNLRLDHCSPRPGTGDYVCFFDHDYAPTATERDPGGGHAQFLVAPAAAPGWYMTILQGCG